MEVFRRWKEVRATNWLTETQKKMLQNIAQEHHLLQDEQGQFELVLYDQISDVAGGSRDIRAFIFERKGDYYIIKRVHTRYSIDRLPLYQNKK